MISIKKPNGDVVEMDNEDYRRLYLDAPMTPSVIKEPVFINTVKVKNNFQSPNWSDAELDIVRQNIDSPIPELHKLLPDRTFKAIGKKVWEIQSGGVKSFSGVKKPFWSDAELKLLRDNRHLDIVGLTNLFPRRTWKAIYKKLCQLPKESGQYVHRKNSKWSRQELHLLKDNLDKHITILCKMFPDKSVGKIYSCIRKHHWNRGVIGSKRRRNFAGRDWSPADDAILRDNPDKSIGELRKLIPDFAKVTIWKHRQKISQDTSHITDFSDRESFIDARAKELVASGGYSLTNAQIIARVEWKGHEKISENGWSDEDISKLRANADKPINELLKLFPDFNYNRIYNFMRKHKMPIIMENRLVRRKSFINSRADSLQNQMNVSRERALSQAVLEFDAGLGKVSSKPAFPNFSEFSKLFDDVIGQHIAFIDAMIKNPYRITKDTLSSLLGVVVDANFFYEYLAFFSKNAKIISEYFGVPNKFKILDEGEKILVYQ